MNSFLDTNSSGWAVLPITQPEIEIFPGDSLIVSQFTLSANQRAVPQLFLHFVGNATFGGLEKCSSGLPMVYAGIYLNFSPSSGILPLLPAVSVGLELPGVAGYALEAAVEVVSPGAYSVVLTNNSASAINSAILTGSVLIKNLYAPV